MGERICQVLIPILNGGSIELQEQAASSMAAASMARDRCKETQDESRNIVVIPGGRPRAESAAAAYNARRSKYRHTYRQVDDWILSRRGYCDVSMDRPRGYDGPLVASETLVVTNVQAHSVMHAAGLAILAFKSAGLTPTLLSVEVKQGRHVAVAPEEYWRWLMRDASDPRLDPYHDTKELLRDRHEIPLSREEKRARQQR